MPGPYLTIVLPVFNEQSTIERAIKRLFAIELPVKWELVVVDDGSTDETNVLLQSLREAFEFLLIVHPENRGKGAAVRSGINRARGRWLTIFDADLELDPDDYTQLLEPVLQGRAEAVYGVRSFGRAHNCSALYTWGNRLISGACSVLYGSRVTDVETCFKLLPTALWRSLDLERDDFGIEAEVTAKLLRLRIPIHEIPISYRARGRGEGKKLRWVDGPRALVILLSIRVGWWPGSAVARQEDGVALAWEQNPGEETW